MRWGVVRAVIVSVGFIVGLMVVGPMASSAGSAPSSVPRMSEHIGESLVVACENGSVVLKHLGEHGAVQVECSQSRIVVVRGPNEKKTSLYRLLRM